MRNRFDQLSKQIGQAALRRSGATFAHDSKAARVLGELETR